MKFTSINSKSAPTAVGGYSQGALIEGADRLLFISGQIPEQLDGSIPSGFEAQARQVWSNIVAQLDAADMAIANLVKVTTFLSSREYADINSQVRQEFLGHHTPALTVIIAEIFDEQWLLEIEAIAAA